MISVLLYCSSVLIILLLYYFYRPVESTPDTINTQNSLSESSGCSGAGSSSTGASNSQSSQQIQYSSLNYYYTNSSNLIANQSNETKQVAIKRATLLRNDSIGSIQTFNSDASSSSSASFNNSISYTNKSRRNLFHQLTNRIFKLYTNYLLVYLLPVYKYLGLNEIYYLHSVSLVSNLNRNKINYDLDDEIFTNNGNLLKSPNLIEDNYKSLDELLSELNRLELIHRPTPINELSPSSTTTTLTGLELNSSINVIIGIDFTASNEWKGRKTFNSQSLHKTLGNKIYNPYQKVISVLGFVLNKLITSSLSNTQMNNINQATANSTNNLNNNSNNNNSNNTLFNTTNNKPTSNNSCSILKIYSYGFGDLNTTDKSVFSLFDPSYSNTTNSTSSNDDNFYVESFDEVLNRYNEIVKKVNLSGPTSFAPIIYKSIEIMKNQQQQYQQRLANTNVSDSVSNYGDLSKTPYHILFIIADGKVSDEDENETIQAIIDASYYPLSIVVIGVGDGPWNTMIKFDDRLCNKSKFDNFQFVDYHRTIKNSKSPDTAFALRALMEIPEQYKIMKKLNYL